jgi:hypothetical protein
VLGWFQEAITTGQLGYRERQATKKTKQKSKQTSRRRVSVTNKKRNSEIKKI